MLVFVQARSPCTAATQTTCTHNAWPAPIVSLRWISGSSWAHPSCMLELTALFWQFHQPDVARLHQDVSPCVIVNYDNDQTNSICKADALPHHSSRNSLHKKQLLLPPLPYSSLYSNMTKAIRVFMYQLYMLKLHRLLRYFMTQPQEPVITKNIHETELSEHTRTAGWGSYEVLYILHKNILCGICD